MSKVTNIEEYQKTNREKALTPKRGKFWCYSCDKQIVHNFEKCPNCGNRQGRKTLKKD